MYVQQVRDVYWEDATMTAARISTGEGDTLLARKTRLESETGTHYVLRLFPVDGVT